MSEIYEFDPVKYSKQECEFLLKNLGKPTIVAMQEVTSGVNPKAVEPIIQRVNELEALKKHSGTNWCGIEAMKEKLTAYLRENEKWKKDNQRFKKAPRYPSMFSFDSKGRAHRGGIGSDSGHVRSYFDEKGQRQMFAIHLVDNELDGWTPPGVTEAPVDPGLKVDDANNRIECTLCGHTEHFKAESRTSYTAARARMSKHLRRATDKVDEHRELYVSEFK